MGISPPNRHVLTDRSFLPSAVTDKRLTSADATETNNKTFDEPGPNWKNSANPENIMPLQKYPCMCVSNRKVKARRASVILTGSPYKSELAQQSVKKASKIKAMRRH